MKIYFCILGILCIPFSIRSEVVKVTYRKWNDCYLMKNDSLEIVVNASSGGRILAFRKNGINFMWEDSTIDGKVLEDYMSSPFHPDAGRFDYGPEVYTSDHHAESWVGTWEVTFIDDYTLELSNTDEGLGLYSTRKFLLDSVHPVAQIQHSMQNISESDKEYWFWGRTLLKTGGKIVAPLNQDSNYPDKWTRYIWGNPVTFASDPDDPGVEIVDSLFTLIPGLAGNSKYGTDAKTGWMAYGYEGMIFAKTFAYFEGEPYLEDNNHIQIFYAANSGINQFIEMEPVSPALILQPGESYSFEENWYVFDHQETTDPAFDPVKAANVLFEFFKSLEIKV